jgi:hypothetical protein
MGQMADKTAGKRIACAGGIEYLFERQGGRYKDLVFMEEQGAMFAFLDDQVFRGPIFMMARAAFTRENSPLS